MTDSIGLAQAVLLFVLSAAVVGGAGMRLARDGDTIAARTRLGGMWVGSVFLALATSLPELMTSTSAAFIGAVDIAAGNLLGSSMANMLILALLTLLPVGAGLLGRAALDQVLGAALAIILNCLAGAFILASTPASYGGVGLGSLVLLAVYLLGTRTLYRHSALARASVAVAELDVAAAAEGAPPLGPVRLEGRASGGTERSLRGAVAGFLAAAVVITAAAPLFAAAAERIAEVTGMSHTMMGTWLAGLATSLPEFVTSLAAVRLGAFDLAVGNLFGSNAVNMVIFVPLDLAHRTGPVFDAIDPAHAISALVASALMSMSLVALVSRARRRFSILEPSGLAMIGVYVLGMLLIASRV